MIKKFQDISINCKRVFAFAFDNAKQCLILAREKVVEEEEEFEVYQIPLRKNLDPVVRKKPLMVNQDATDVGQIVAKFNVYTSPLSVFTKEENLTMSPYYAEKEETVFVLQIVLLQLLDKSFIVAIVYSFQFDFPFKLSYLLIMQI